MTEQRDEIATARRKKRAKYRVRRLKTLAVAVALILLVLFAVDIVTSTSLEDITDYFKCAFSDSRDYPFETTKSAPHRSEQLSMAYALLTDRELDVYSKRGGLLQSYEHDMSNSRMETSANRVLLYNALGKNIVALSRTSVISEFSTERQIISADISPNGTIAALERGDRYTCQLEVFEGSRYSKIMTWYGSKGFPLFVTFADNSRLAYVVTIGEKNGMIISYISAIDVKSEKELFTTQIDGMVLKIFSLRSNYIVAVTDVGLCEIYADGVQSGVEAYGQAPLIAAQSDNGHVVLGFGDNSRPQINSLRVFDKSAKLCAEIPDCETIKDIYVGSDRFYILGDGTVSEYNFKGELRKKYTCDKSSLRIMKFSDIIIILPTSVQHAVEATEEGKQ
ncbi:MAG: DUF5711 family protein [Oscillospiraceae bacterium]